MDKLTGSRTILPTDATALAQVETHQQRLKNVQQRGLNTPADIDKAAGGFEALLLHEMLKSMWATVDSSGWLGDDSNEAQIYRDMLNQAIADTTSQGRGIGVKDFLRRELLKAEIKG